jgi:hypothetical protein
VFTDKRAFVVIESIVREPILSESEQEPVSMAHEITRFIEGDHHSNLSCSFVDFSYSDQRINRFYIVGMLEFLRTRAPEVSLSSFPAFANFYSGTDQQSFVSG